jgi:exodeoxyribonuclease VII small subunit
MPPKIKKNTFSYEEGLRKLEDLLKKLEAGNLPLEEALAQFEQGIKLSKQCQTVLKQVEQQVLLLTGEEDTGYKEKSFNSEEPL